MPDRPGAEPLWGLLITALSSSSVKLDGMVSSASGGIFGIRSGGIEFRKVGMVLASVGVEVAREVKKFLKNLNLPRKTLLTRLALLIKLNWKGKRHAFWGKTIIHTKYTDFFTITTCM